MIGHSGTAHHSAFNGTAAIMGAAGIAALLLLPALAHATDPIQDLVDVPVAWTGSRPPTNEQVVSAIVAGCVSKGWACQLAAPGEIRGVLRVRTHRADVRIPFDTAKYSILYVSSENLDYKASKRRIHKNYNKWVMTLSSRINAELVKQASSR